MGLLETAIRGYCEDHPRCADTVAGIQRWWLGDLTVSVEELEAVLDRLVDVGVLEHRVLPDGATIYLPRVG